jgi:hypothetical protein
MRPSRLPASRSAAAFLAAGAAIFAAWHFTAAARRSVEVTPELQAALVRELEASLGRPATDLERRSTVDAWVEDEVLFREARARRLDAADPVVRRRMVQAMRFLLEAQGPRALAAPTPRGPTLVADVEHRFFHARARADAAMPKGALAPVDEGEAFIAGPTVKGLTPARAAATFGPELGAQLFALEPGQWKGPLASPLGWHWVRVVDRRAVDSAVAPAPPKNVALAELRAAYRVRLPEASR